MNEEYNGEEFDGESIVYVDELLAQNHNAEEGIFWEELSEEEVEKIDGGALNALTISVTTKGTGTITTACSVVKFQGVASIRSFQWTRNNIGATMTFNSSGLNINRGSKYGTVKFNLTYTSKAHPERAYTCTWTIVFQPRNLVIQE